MQEADTARAARRADTPALIKRAGCHMKLGDVDGEVAHHPHPPVLKPVLLAVADVVDLRADRSMFWAAMAPNILRMGP